MSRKSIVTITKSLSHRSETMRAHTFRVRFTIPVFQHERAARGARRLGRTTTTCRSVRCEGTRTGVAAIGTREPTIGPIGRACADMASATRLPLHEMTWWLYEAERRTVRLSANGTQSSCQGAPPVRRGDAQETRAAQLGRGRAARAARHGSKWGESREQSAP